MLQIGSIYFQYKQETAYRPKRQFVYIQGLERTDLSLEIEVLERDEALMRKEVESYLHWAVDRAWGREASECWKIQQDGPQIRKVDWLIRDEQALAMKIRTLEGQQALGAFQQQQNWQDLQTLGEEMNRRWPSIWQQLYTYNSIDGGWGPDAGFFPLFPTSVHQHNIKTTYSYFQKEHPAQGFWQKRKELLPFLHWGTGVYSLLDTNSMEGQVYSFDPNLKNEENRWEDCLWLHQESLYAWLKFWLDSKDYGVALWRNMYERKGIL